MVRNCGGVRTIVSIAFSLCLVSGIVCAKNSELHDRDMCGRLVMVHKEASGRFVEDDDNGFPGIFCYSATLRKTRYDFSGAFESGRQFFIHELTGKKRYWIGNSNKKIFSVVSGDAAGEAIPTWFIQWLDRWYSGIDSQSCAELKRQSKGAVRCQLLGTELVGTVKAEKWLVGISDDSAVIWVEPKSREAIRIMHTYLDKGTEKIYSGDELRDVRFETLNLKLFTISSDYKEDKH